MQEKRRRGKNFITNGTVQKTAKREYKKKQEQKKPFKMITKAKYQK